jgi:hypothetical protein
MPHKLVGKTIKSTSKLKTRYGDKVKLIPNCIDIDYFNFNTIQRYQINRDGLGFRWKTK